eukprot:3830411-Prymnesium_polylepis.1
MPHQSCPSMTRTSRRPLSLRRPRSSVWPRTQVLIAALCLSTIDAPTMTMAATYSARAHAKLSARNGRRWTGEQSSWRECSN